MVCPPLDNEKIAKAYKMLDDYMGIAVNELKLNYYEVLIVFAMMDANVKAQNVAGYLAESVTRFAEKINKEDEELR